MKALIVSLVILSWTIGVFLVGYIAGYIRGVYACDKDNDDLEESW